jgi:hypothetical protein
LLGIGLTAAPSILGSGALAGLFSNPITAIVGGALLVGSIFLGRAAQRRRDEQASGDFLTQAVEAVHELKRQVSVDEISGSQARSIFNSQIIPTFQQQIQTLKTASVRQSRLTNQVRDLRSLFESEVAPEITQQQRRKFVNSRLVPEFASGGVIPGIDRGFDSVLMRGRPGEMVLNEQQQSSVARISGLPHIFQMAGVPSAGVQMADGSQAFQFGGSLRPSAGGTGGDIVVDFSGAVVELHLSEDSANRLFVRGGRSEAGRRVIVSQVKQAISDRELKK